MTATPQSTTLERPDVDRLLKPDVPWVTIVWDDPVNLMSYVTFVFTEYFRYPRSKAKRLMMQVHTEGRAVVSTGSREEMERDVQAMHTYGLWATLQKADQVSYFRSRRKGRVHVEMPALSALLIADLARQLIELLSDGEPTGEGSLDPLEELVALDSPRDPPTDPALLRLLPDAYPDDAEVSAEFRRFTEQSLRQAKIGAAKVVLASLSGTENDGLEPVDAESTVEFELTADDARAWMRCLTDLRLTLAARLDVSADDDETIWLSLPEDDARGSLYRIYGWLGFQLETLLDASQA